jgi:hypothetical protein
MLRAVPEQACVPAFVLDQPDQGGFGDEVCGIFQPQDP